MEPAPYSFGGVSCEESTVFEIIKQKLGKRALHLVAKTKQLIADTLKEMNKHVADMRALFENNQEGHDSSVGGHEDIQTVELPEDYNSTSDDSSQRKDFEEREKRPRHHMMTERIGGIRKCRKVKPDLRNMSERTNLMFDGLWTVKSLFLMDKLMAKLCLIYMTFMYLAMPGTCSEKETATGIEKRVKFGQAVTLPATFADEVAERREWLYSDTDGSMPIAICTWEGGNLTINNFCPDVHCSPDGQLNIARATLCHQGTYVFNSYYSSRPTTVKYQVIIIDDEPTTEKPKAEPAVSATTVSPGSKREDLNVILSAVIGTTAVLAGILGIVLAVCVYKRTIRRRYNLANDQQEVTAFNESQGAASNV